MTALHSIEVREPFSEFRQWMDGMHDGLNNKDMRQRAHHRKKTRGDGAKMAADGMVRKLFHDNYKFESFKVSI